MGKLRTYERILLYLGKQNLKMTSQYTTSRGSFAAHTVCGVVLFCFFFIHW